MFIKFPKTKHIEKHWAEASLIQYGQLMVVEEKMDGTRVGISFDNERNFRIQSRGSYILSGLEFSLLKQWVRQHFAASYELLGSRYILFGEWLYAKHTVYYDLLLPIMI